MVVIEVLVKVDSDWYVQGEYLFYYFMGVCQGEVDWFFVIDCFVCSGGGFQQFGM